ncbi:MAG: ATP-binding cassette domain-containing protein [Lachnospiraceae bacterium]|nr:ATP-binding cassette domain-containing protein [Lachnospiraceae bacterium]
MKLEIKNVTKTYGTKTALDNFSVTFDSGVYGILGANGAGKSTLINLITDNVPRDRGKRGGQILYDGVEIKKLGAKFRAMVGYMPQQQGYYEDFSVRAFLKYIASVKGISSESANRQIHELLKVVNLYEKADERIGSFSGGMKQRVLLAQALLGDPEILILDEPTAGLDPKERINIRNYISQLSRDKIILLATHVVSDIECISDEVILMQKGKLVTMGTPQELIADLHGKVAEISCLPEELERLQKQYRVGNVRQRKDGIVLRVVGDDLPRQFKRRYEDIDLEDVYLYWLGNS